MFRHVTLGANDFTNAEKFHDAVMEAPGHSVLFKTPGSAADGTPSATASRERANQATLVLHDARERVES